MRGFVAAVVTGLMLVGGSFAFAGSSTDPEPIGKGYFCRGGTQATCAGADVRKGHLRVVVVRIKASSPGASPLHQKDPKQIRDISYKACSTAPSGNTRCVPRRTHSRKSPQADGLLMTYDSFRFTSAFPHRDAGTYKLNFRRNGHPWGQTVRLRLTP